MDGIEIKRIRDSQRAYFETGATLNIDRRIYALKKLHSLLDDNEEEIKSALKADLGKSGFESDMCEIRLTLSEIAYMIKHVRKFSRMRTVHTPLAQFKSRSYTLPSPYGTVLVMSPWNYPILLTLEPLADAIASGNTVILKPSAYSPNTSSVIKKLIESTFPSEYIAVIEGGREENKALLKEHFDYIFFTGSKRVGHEVMRSTAEYLTPITLELGGKSPVIVEKSADIRIAARRIVFGKYLNLGQTCVAPDYILVDNTIRSSFIAEVKKEIIRQFGENPLTNDSYGKIINKRHFDRVRGLIAPEKVVFGARVDESTLRIEPTVLDSVTLCDSVMKEEIFGPIMPIIGYDSLDEAVSIIKQFDHPLAFYIFTRNKKIARHLTSSIGFGGGCINDTIIHLATSEMGFGGFGESGIGSYHGKAGFDTFSHYKSIVDKSDCIDLPMRYMPYNGIYHKLIRFFLK